MLFTWTRIILHPVGIYGLFLMIGLTFLTAIIWSYKLAKSNSPALLKSYQRWYVYVIVIVLQTVIYGIVDLQKNRASWFGYESYSISSGAMKDTFQPGDFIVANTWAYIKSKPQRGDLLIFEYPHDRNIIFIKRVIGLPGEKIEIEDGQILINGTAIDEPYITPEYNTVTKTRPFTPVTVPQGNYFVLGDNRDHSNDSRYWGLVPEDHLVGKAIYIWLSKSPEDGIQWDRIGKAVM